MTDFLSWWADHWPLIPVIVLYPLWHNIVNDLIWRWLIRRREP